jgi:rubredoxin
MFPMKKLRHFVFAIALILSVAHSSFATTWAPADVVCPVCKHKNTFMQIMSFGNYIYHWPEKFQYIYWPLTDGNVLYSCSNCHYTAFMFDFSETKPDKLAQIKQMLAGQPFEGKYAKYTDIPMSVRLAIAEKVYKIIGEDDEWWCRFERVRGYHFAREKKETEAAEARRKALNLAEKMLQSKATSPSEKELFLITGGMKYFLKDREGAIKDLEHGLTLKFAPANLEKEKAEGFDQYLSGVFTEFIAAIRDEEKAKPDVRPGVKAVKPTPDPQ